MLKFMKSQYKTTPERTQKQKELFSFAKCCYHGFPSRPSALAWDPKLRLLALATKSGDIRIYGTPGVEVYNHHDGDGESVVHLCFLPGRGRLVSLCDDNSLHLWEVQLSGTGTELVKLNQTSLEGKLKKISVIIVDSVCHNLMVGTEGGNIYIFHLETFAMSENIIYQDVVMQNVPEDYKVNPGPVEAIAQHPTEPNKILIGYQRGLIVLWDKKNLCADQTYVCSQQLESICWHSDATSFMTSHNDGSYVIWSATDSTEQQDGPNTVYGPFPCKPITKIAWLPTNDMEMIVFSGGMPRASYGDRHTVTAVEGETHVTFNISSKVIDFTVTQDTENGVAECLIILAEEEIIFIDLQSEGWPAFKNPYLCSLHSSAVTCSSLITNVLPEVYTKLKEAGQKQVSHLSSRPWPVNGGSVVECALDSKTVLLTGHEDGTVRFWDATDMCVSLLYKFSTSVLFSVEDLPADTACTEDEDWPPFRKAGIFDPYSDDPRLGIKKLEMCPFTGLLVVAGTAGQVIMLHQATEERAYVPECIDVNLVAETDNFVWKSHEKIPRRTEDIKFDVGMQVTAMIQFYPPASCTSLTVHSEWGLIACGTAHGFSLFDVIQKRNLLAKNTLTASDIANASDEGPMSRRKSLKKSLRESFRRLRRGRSQRKAGKGAVTSPQGAAPQARSGGAPRTNEDDTVRPMERAVEARSRTPDYIGSMVRCLHLTKCFIANSQAMSATLWAGTNSGIVYIFTIAVPQSDKRSETPLTVQLGKEIHLKHGAPVISVAILDGINRPFPVPLAVKKEVAPSPDKSGPHKVLICSEEQLKVFSLPQLKHFCKYKLTAHEGSRVRKIGYCDFVSTVDEKYKESCLILSTNQGDISVYSLPDCRRQLQAHCLKKEDINGINSTVFNKKGEVLFLVSPSELSRVTLSAKHSTKPSGTVSVSKIIIPEKKDPKENEVGGDDEKAVTDSVCEETKGGEEQTKTEDPSKTEAGGGGGGGREVVPRKDDVKENGDNSVLSGDLTIDSVRDHMDELKLSSEKVVEVVSSTSTSTTMTTTVATSSSTIKQESVKVIKSTTITSVSSSEESSVQVVETKSSSVANSHGTVNGPENRRMAPLAKTESFFIKNPK